ncbi:MAG TPA: hypothetical protein DEP23_01615 [Ruminococcaceae bacterium]|nr:hypothetical protein [Oscillospiraceae bacterium]
MSEIQKAIKELQTIYFPTHSHDKAIQMATSALQEQSEREKGCEYCNPEAMCDNPIFAKHINGYWKSGKCCDTGDGARANFCPRCGRDLRKPVQK